jgi:hypothetical protein
MRRLLALSALAAAAASFAAPASAAPICTPTDVAGVCVQVTYCPDACFFDPAVDPYCDIPGPVIAACEAVDRLYIDLWK